MKKNHVLFLIGAPLLAVALIAFRVYYSAVIWRYPGPELTFVIKPNESFASINGRLKNENLIHSSRLFHRYCQYKGVMNKFKTGTYTIRTNSNLLDVYSILLLEKVKANLFTIPEGKNLYEIGRMLESSGITKYDEFISLAKDAHLLKELNIEADSAEGYLYPESYDFGSNQPADYIIKTMVKEFRKRTEGLDYSQTTLSPKEVLILASIVEKETGDKSERPMIAGVFSNRLKIKMRLQSDPTTIYGIYENYRGNITKKDLLTPSDYNTYTLPALPKGPISNPGLASIEAVLKPTEHKYLYFVSQNDGTHIFSETYEKHLEAVRKWQQTAKNREGRSWRDHTSN